MLDILQDSITRWVILVAVLVNLVVVAVYIVRRLRGHAGDDVSATHEVRTNFKEMHDQGDISDAEYRKLKTVLDQSSHKS